MFHKDLISALNDIAESLRIIAKRENEFPIILGDKTISKMVVTNSNLSAINIEAEEIRQEQIDKQIDERGEGFFFAEDSVDEDLITGGYPI